MIRDDRAVSDVVSFTLVFTTIIFMIGVVTVSGVGTLGDVQEGTESNVAESTMRNYAGTLGDHRTSGAPRRSSTIKLQGHQLALADSDIEISIAGGPTLPSSPNALVRRTDTDERLVYESGALFRTRDDDGVTVRQLPFRCGDDTAHISLMQIQGDFRYSSDNRVTLESELVSQDISRYRADSVTVDISGSRTSQDVWESAFRDDWDATAPSPSSTYECGASTGDIDIVIHRTTIDVDLIN